MSSHSSPSARKQCDFTKLLIAGYELELRNGNTQDFHVTFHGPKETVYEDGVWKVHVELPEDYPFSSPSIGFVNKILHPNVDESSGSVCLDVINQTWTPLYSLVNVFEIFLPQLLTYPNPSDPLNSEAAALLLRDKIKYTEKVKEYVRLHANREMWERQKRASGGSGVKGGSSSSSGAGDDTTRRRLELPTSASAAARHASQETTEADANRSPEYFRTWPGGGQEQEAVDFEMVVEEEDDEDEDEEEIEEDDLLDDDEDDDVGGL